MNFMHRESLPLFAIRRLSLRFVWCCFVLAGLLGLGCGSQDSIRSYEVAKSAAEPQDRMLGAIVPRGEQAWFFKLTVPKQVADELTEPFMSFVKSVQFDASGNPQWTLPSGWQQQPGNAMRFATLAIETPAGSKELSVTSLGMPEGDRSEYVLANVNRWRNQLGLSAVAASELKEATIQVEVAGETAWIVDMEGKLSSAGMGGAPFAGGGAGGAPFAGGGPTGSSPTAGSDTSRPATPRISYDTPEGWVKGQEVSSRGGFSIPREAAFNVTDDDQQVEITVTRLPAQSPMRLANINRWRGQVGLEEADEATIASSIKPVTVAGQAAEWIELPGTEQTILGVIATRGNESWFIKLQGNSGLAMKEKERFQQFVASLRFNN
jgi:hypothetical protein